MQGSCSRVPWALRLAPLALLATSGSAAAASTVERPPSGGQTLNASGADSGEEDVLQALGILCQPEFTQDVWGKRSAVLARSTEEVADLFTLADLAMLLRESGDRIQVTGGTAANVTAVPSKPSRHAGTLLDYFRNATLILTSIETRLPRVAALARKFAKAFGITVEVNLYITPPGAQGLGLHNDRQDNFVFQVAGQKSWKTWDVSNDSLKVQSKVKVAGAPFFRHTTAVSAEDGVVLESMPEPSLDERVEPGSLLYIPRGSLHVASTAGELEASVHLSIGALSMSFSYALAIYNVVASAEMRQAVEAAGWDTHRFRQALMKLVDEYYDGMEFRASMPFAWARWQDGVDASPACASLGPNMSNGGSSSSSYVKSHSEDLFQRVLAGAPSRPVRTALPLSALHEARIAFQRTLEKSEKDFPSPALPLSIPAEVEYLLLPESLFVNYVAAGLDGYGKGELQALFSWCGRGFQGAQKVRWPAGVLPMLQVLAASRSRRLKLADLSRGKDMVPKLLFALELARIPLVPAIELLPAGSAMPTSNERDPDCRSHRGRSSDL